MLVNTGQEMAGEARIDWSSRKQISAALTLNKFKTIRTSMVLMAANYGMINISPIACGNWRELGNINCGRHFQRLWQIV